MRKIILCSNNHKEFDQISSEIQDIYTQSKKTLIVPGFSERDDLILKSISKKFLQPLILSESITTKEIKDVDCIILCAGHPEKQLVALQKSQFDKMIQFFPKNIIAFSAG